MKAGSPFIEQVREEAGGFAAESLKQLEAAVMTGYHTEHNANDTHSIIHATGAIYERGRVAPTMPAMGEFFSLFRKVTDFTGFGTMTWTVTAVGIITYGFTVIGDTMTVIFDIRASTIVAVTTAAVQIRIPLSMVAAHARTNPVRIVDNGVGATGYAQTAMDSSFISIFRTDGVAWTASAANTNVQGEVSFKFKTT